MRTDRSSSFRVPPVAAALIVGYGVKTYIEASHDRHLAHLQAMERESAAMKQRNEKLQDVYGDRSSLDELEKAIEFYESK